MGIFLWQDLEVESFKTENKSRSLIVEDFGPFWLPTIDKSTF
jgi:hypothetical protein